MTVEKGRLFSIGQFAALHGVNKKTLMWYDEIGRNGGRRSGADAAAGPLVFDLPFRLRRHLKRSVLCDGLEAARQAVSCVLFYLYGELFSELQAL